MPKKDCKNKKIKVVMGEYKRGKLTTHGRTVKDRKQAISIALSMARKECRL